MTKATMTKSRLRTSQLLLTPQERLAILEKIRGMWKNRKPDPIKELKQIRRGWNRPLPRP